MNKNKYPLKYEPGFNVMITIFGDFLPTFYEKIGVFLKTKGMIIFSAYVHKYQQFESNRPFLSLFCRKYFENHNINPRMYIDPGCT
jgi:hypothetical protein